jgi:predicted Zn-dependent protease
MSISILNLQGLYYDGNRPVGLPAILTVAGREATLSGVPSSRTYQSRQLCVSPRVGRADRFITLPDGGEFQCEDRPSLDRLPQESHSEGLVAWLEARAAVAIAAVAVIAAVLLAGYFYGLPVAAESISARIPIETEIVVGEKALAWMDDNHLFKPTRLTKTAQDHIRDGFGTLRSGLPFEQYYRLEFRDAPIGPNAFALPGAIIVITDDMVETAESTEEVLAVLAHEIGHVEQHHTMRHLLQDSLVATLITSVTADAASLNVSVAGLPTLLAQTKYSRQFESEADDFAFKLLKQHNLSPTAFATLMERIAENGGHDGPFAFLSTHPATAERIEQARAAGEQ